MVQQVDLVLGRLEKFFIDVTLSVMVVHNAW
jgi:hypothetical protein